MKSLLIIWIVAAAAFTMLMLYITQLVDQNVQRDKSNMIDTSKINTYNPQQTITIKELQGGGND